MLRDTEYTQRLQINRLPSELLACIFQIVVHSAYPRDIVDSASYANPAVKFVQVCSRWRQVALQVRSLWSCVVFLYKDDTNYERISSTARMQLERTRGCPIDLFLLHELSHAEFQSTVQLITPYMKQLRSLTVQLRRSEDIETLLEGCLIAGTVGTLSRLEIIRDNSFPPLFHRAHPQTLEQLDKYLQSVRILKLHETIFGWKSAVFDHLDELVLRGASVVYDPEADNVKEWRYKLQRAFLNGTELAYLASLFTTIEQYDKMTVEYLAYSKIGKVMRKIIQLINVPSDDQYGFRRRAQVLITKWQLLICASEDRALAHQRRPAQ
ncbi:hypothetical protein BDV93DRAFT_608970 [Ceratobasidium sp. AG-I]|nr:hypothetical protein BDV93DRAFT_608970 [Ceratobasidium sp. AG-I]